MQHIDYSTLSAFADGDLDPALSEAVSSHLRVCAKCRAELQFIRSLGDGLRALQTPLAPRDAFDRIWPEARRAIPTLELPLKRRQRSRRGVLLALAAGVMGLVAAALVLTVGPDRVMAGSSTLTLERVRTGAMALRYETISPLAAETSVRARIRYWIPDSLRFAQNEGGFSAIELSRSAAGTFEGVVDLPPGTVYAAAAVEDLGGTYLDSDFGQFWEYLETDANGLPTLEARRYQILAALEFNAPRAAQVAEEATLEFPEQPEFWLWRSSFELASLPAASVDSLLRVHVARIGTLDDAARDGNPGPGGDGCAQPLRPTVRTERRRGLLVASTARAPSTTWRNCRSQPANHYAVPKHRSKRNWTLSRRIGLASGLRPRPDSGCDSHTNSPTRTSRRNGWLGTRPVPGAVA